MVQPRTPKKLSKEQRAALEQLAKVLPPEDTAARPRDDAGGERGVFDRVKDLFS
jgi:DnaJ-class molecular chaperone